jgi:hypothetical protein
VRLQSTRSLSTVGPVIVHRPTHIHEEDQLPIASAVDPCDFVIFGGTGDLAVRKLLPALYLRDRDGQLTADTRIIAVARDDEFTTRTPTGRAPSPDEWVGTGRELFASMRAAVGPAAPYPPPGSAPPAGSPRRTWRNTSKRRTLVVSAAAGSPLQTPCKAMTGNVFPASPQSPQRWSTLRCGGPELHDRFT